LGAIQRKLCERASGVALYELANGSQARYGS
jgi:hypothetical protein